MPLSVQGEKAFSEGSRFPLPLTKQSLVTCCTVCVCVCVCVCFKTQAILRHQLGALLDSTGRQSQIPQVKGSVLQGGLPSASEANDGPRLTRDSDSS